MTPVGGNMADHNNHRWMERLPRELHDIPIHHLAIPGSHDSCTGKLDADSHIAPNSPAIVYKFGSKAKGIIYHWSKTQSLTIREQLDLGIRYLDLRVSVYKQRQTTGVPGSALYLVHGLYSQEVTHALQEIADFLDRNEKEVVFLDFNHFYQMSPRHHDALYKSIVDIFGKDRLCSPTNELMKLTLKSLWTKEKGCAFNQQVLVFYHNGDTVRNYGDVLWPGFMMVSKWLNKNSGDKILHGLHLMHEDRQKQTETQTLKFHVSQAVLTPTLSNILWNPRGSIRRFCLDCNKGFVNWVKGQKPGPNGINICIMDYVEDEDFVSAVIGLNRLDYFQKKPEDSLSDTCENYFSAEESLSGAGEKYEEFEEVSYKEEEMSEEDMREYEKVDIPAEDGSKILDSSSEMESWVKVDEN